MALPLLSLASQLSGEPSHILVKSTLATLKKNFKASPIVFPLLFLTVEDESVSNCIKSVFAASQANPLDNFYASPDEIDYFACKYQSETTAVVWPRPVIVHEQHLMLIRMWDVDNSISEEEARKALCALFSMTAVCIASFQDFSYEGLATVQTLFEEMRVATEIDTTEFLVVGEEGDVSKNRKLRRQRDEYWNLECTRGTHFLRFDESQDFSALFYQLFYEKGVARFANYSRLALCQLRIENHSSFLFDMLTTNVSAANVSTDFQSFLHLIPKPNSPDYQLQKAKLHMQFENREKVAQMSAVSFFSASESQGVYTLDRSHLEVIRSNFDFHQPTVALVLIGQQGIGKSHFLNSIVRHCLDIPQRVAMFLSQSNSDKTTKATQFLSHPLLLPSSRTQLLLIDLEGLGGVELTHGNNAVLQQNLVASLLTIASVPCIIVKNELAIKPELEKYLSRLQFYATHFSFLIERVFFLYHDKDYQRNEGSSVLAEWIREFNTRFFDGRSVIKLMNKPAFNDASKREMCQLFLTDFLADCNFPKKNSSGSLLNISDLLTQIEYISQHSSADFSPIARNERMNNLAKTAIGNVDKVFKQLMSLNDTTLVSGFNEEVRKVISQLHLENEEDETARYVTISVENYAQSLRLKLASLDHSYAYVSKMSPELLAQVLDDVIAYFFEKSFWKQAFCDRTNELLRKLKELVWRFPPSGRLILEALPAVEAKRDSLKGEFIWVYLNYCFSTFLSSLVGEKEDSQSNFTAESVLSGESKRLIAPESALVLYHIGSVVAWNPQVLEICGATKLKNVLLMLGTSSRVVSAVLNQLVLKLSPFTMDSSQPFRDCGDAQVLDFMYPGRDYDGTIISLTLTGSAYSKEIAKVLCTRVSVVCVCSDSEFGWLIDAVSSKKTQRHTPEFAFFLFGEQKSELSQQISPRLVIHRLPFILREVELTSESSLASLQLELMSCMNGAVPIKAETFRELIEDAQSLCIPRSASFHESIAT